MFTKQQAKQENDKLDQLHKQEAMDKTLADRFEKALEEWEKNPDVSFLSPKIEDKSLLVQNNDGPKKTVRFRALSPEQEVADDNDSKASVSQKTSETSHFDTTVLENEIKSEILLNSELLVQFIKVQRSVQQNLLSAQQQKEIGLKDEPSKDARAEMIRQHQLSNLIRKTDKFSGQLKELSATIELLSMVVEVLNGQLTNLKLFNEVTPLTDYAVPVPVVVVTDESESNNNNNAANAVEEIGPSWFRKK